MVLWIRYTRLTTAPTATVPCTRLATSMAAVAAMATTMVTTSILLLQLLLPVVVRILPTPTLVELDEVDQNETEV